MLELNKIYNCDCLEGLRKLDDSSVDLTVTSPPYDNLRTYGDTCDWSFDIFKPIAEELYRVTKKGGVVVWVVGDACINGGETGSSFRQALYFMELGFKLHDTMIYEKNSSTFPAKLTSQRYSQIYEYMFVFSKGKIRNDIRLIADKRNKWAGWTNWGQHSQYDATGNLVKSSNIKPIAEFSLRTNIWKYSVSFNDKTGHPAVFPEKLAEDHILSWSLEGDTVLDPFMGSGTTAKMAMINGRNYIGFEKNEEYYNVSLNRVGKYEGAINPNISATTINDEEFIVNTEDDKEEAGKTELFNKLVAELNDYFNEQSLGILKNLRLTFQSKSNDERVKKVLSGDNGMLNESVKQEALHVEPEKECELLLFADETEDNEKKLETPHFISAEELEQIDNFTTMIDEIDKTDSIKDLKDFIVDYCNQVIPDIVKREISKQEKADDTLTKNVINEPIVQPIITPEKKKRGRPAGSKNKPKMLLTD